MFIEINPRPLWVSAENTIQILLGFLSLPNFKDLWNSKKGFGKENWVTRSPMATKKRSMNWMSIIGLCLLIAGTVFTYLGSVASDRNINSLQTEVRNVKDYSYYATLDMYGRPFTANNGLTFSNSLSAKMEHLLVVKDGKIYPRGDPGLIPNIDSVIAEYPYFPFGYWVKYNYLKAQGDPGWQVIAKKAVEIFENTTSIKGHNPSHDEALNMTRRDLEIH